MIVKKHLTHDGKIILAICDKEVLGKKFEQEDKQLDLTSSFYNGKQMTEQEIIKLLPEINSVNIVGERSIKFALHNNLIEKENIKKISNIPYAISIFIE